MGQGQNGGQNGGRTGGRAVSAQIPWQEATEAWRRLLETAREAGASVDEPDTADAPTGTEAGETPPSRPATTVNPEKEIQS